MITAVQCERKKNVPPRLRTLTAIKLPLPPRIKVGKNRSMSRREKKRPFLYPALLTVPPIIEFGGGRGGMKEAEKMWGDVFSLAPVLMNYH